MDHSLQLTQTHEAEVRASLGVCLFAALVMHVDGLTVLQACIMTSLRGEEPAECICVVGADSYVLLVSKFVWPLLVFWKNWLEGHRVKLFGKT